MAPSDLREDTRGTGFPKARKSPAWDVFSCIRVSGVYGSILYMCKERVPVYTDGEANTGGDEAKDAGIVMLLYLCSA